MNLQSRDALELDTRLPGRWFEHAIFHPEKFEKSLLGDCDGAYSSSSADFSFADFLLVDFLEELLPDLAAASVAAAVPMANF